MENLLLLLVAVILAYLLGSVPFAIISSRLFKLADPRTYGSGNPGATNVLRSGNKKAALFTLLGDLLKGWLAVTIAIKLNQPLLTVYAVALAVFLGHLYPVFLKFVGGKGVATAAGVLLALNGGLGLFCIMVWLATAYLFRYSSLAALFAAISAPLYVALTQGVQDNLLFCVGIISMMLMARHAENFQRLLAGQETKIGQSRNKQQHDVHEKIHPHK